MASLDGVVEEWDDSEVVRQRLRDHHMLIVPAPFKEKVQVNVECGEHNFETLKPLVRRLRDESGSVGMHLVPNLMREIFG